MSLSVSELANVALFDDCQIYFSLCVNLAKDDKNL